jgi:hypothetical protein
MPSLKRKVNYSLLNLRLSKFCSFYFCGLLYDYCIVCLQCVMPNGRMIDHWWVRKGFEGNSSGLSRYYPGISQEGLKETTKIISQDSWCCGQYSNWASSEQENITAVGTSHKAVLP